VASPAAAVRDCSTPTATVTERRVVECYHDAQTARDQSCRCSTVGLLTLEQTRTRRTAVLGDLRQGTRLTRRLDEVPRNSKNSNRSSPTSILQLLVFQSLPDSWAIDQLFPIMPIHRLGERPTRKGVLADITCDSDAR